MNFWGRQWQSRHTGRKQFYKLKEHKRKQLFSLAFYDFSSKIEMVEPTNFLTSTYKADIFK